MNNDHINNDPVNNDQWKPRKFLGIFPFLFLDLLEDAKRRNPERYPSGLPFRTYAETINGMFWINLFIIVALCCLLR